MTYRTFAIPTVAVGLALGTACTGDAIVGFWDITQIVSGPYTVDLPNVETYTYEGTTYTYTLTADIEFDEELAGTLRTHFTYSDGTNTETETDSYAATATKVDGRTFDVAIDSNGLSLDLTCSIDGDAMDCDGTDGDGEAASISATLGEAPE
jgi:hypothetical protein